MFAISSAASTPTALSVPPSTVAVTVSDLVSARLTAVGVSGPLSNIAPDNNNQGNSQTAPVASVQTSDAQAGKGADALTGNFETNGPSSAFLAQLFSQNEGEEQDDQIALSNSFARFAPATLYNVLAGYSVVKYRPSDAGLPSAYASPAPTSEASVTGRNTAAIDYQA